MKRVVCTLIIILGIVLIQSQIYAKNVDVNLEKKEDHIKIMINSKEQEKIRGGLIKLKLDQPIEIVSTNGEMQVTGTEGYDIKGNNYTNKIIFDANDNIGKEQVEIDIAVKMPESNSNDLKAIIDFSDASNKIYLGEETIVATVSNLTENKIELLVVKGNDTESNGEDKKQPQNNVENSENAKEETIKEDTTVKSGVLKTPEGTGFGEKSAIFFVLILVVIIGYICYKKFKNYK